ncbi:MAG: phosphoglycerate dehydrogenase [Bdellovibrionaceae bacterium]|nr:phosphoglycerate dehydrogenase [Pseudobdellovibrionaceae bacterium]
MNNKNITVLLTENIHKQAEIVLKELDFKIKRLNKAPSEKELVTNLKQVNVLCSRSRTHINKNVLLKSNLNCIGVFCIGVSQVDLKTACEKGVPVFNAPYGNTRSVAEMVIGLLVALSRSLFDHSQNLHKGIWSKSAEGCFELRGKTLGIIGYGNIGSQVSVLAEAFGMKTLYYDIVSKLPIGNAKPSFNLKNLLKNSDFVTLHVPDTPQTKKLIRKKEISWMKKGAYLINTSRGTVVDILALKQALKTKYLAGAAMDVFPIEPKSNQEEFRSPLQNMESTILTPHVGGSTEEAQLSIVFEVCKSLKRFLKTGSIQNSVNFPDLLVPAIEPKVTRVINIHKNQPGVLTEINKLVSRSGVNINSQYLATNEKVGYLIMDLEKKNVQKLAEKMSKLEVSIKTRVIV